MQTQDNTTNTELAFLRALAEAGQSQPLQVGPYLIAGGAWFAGASLLLTLAQLGVLALSESSVAWVFIIAAIGCAANYFLLIRRDSHSTERGRNRLVNASWSGAGIGILAFCVAVSVLAYRSGNEEVLSTISLSVLATYGLVWWITGMITEQKWMKTIALASFASMLLVAWFAATPYAWLSYTTALLISALLPGLYISRTAARQP